MHRKIPTILILAGSVLSILIQRSAATPFTIDGSTVYVSAGFVGVRTSTPITVLDVNGDAQFGSGATKSTFTAAGLLKLTSSGIQWADGSVSTTASAGGGGGSITISTGSVALSFAVAPANNFNVCYATFSMISTGRPIRLSISGSAETNCNTSARWGYGFLMDGGFLSGFSSSSQGWAVTNSLGATWPTFLGNSVILPPQGAGTRTFCLTLYSSLSGSCTLTFPSATSASGRAFFQGEETGL